MNKISLQDSSVVNPATAVAAPGPTGWQMGRKLLNAQRNPVRNFLQAQQTFGGVVQLPLGLRKLYLVSDPEAVKYVLQDNNRNYTKRGNVDNQLTLSGNGLLNSEGDFWRRQRRLAQPAFHRQHIAAFGTAMVEETEKMLAQWETYTAAQRPFDVAQEMMHLTLAIVSRTLFGTALSEAEMNQVGQAMPHLLRETRKRVLRPRAILHKLPTRTNRAYDRYLAQLDSIVYRMINERRQSGAEKNDLLGLLLAARDEETGEGMSDLQLRDEAMTIFLAGHETTANLLAWAWYLLGQHTAVRQRLQAELQEVLGGRLPTTADMPHLTYTNMVIQEVMRLYPPAWAILRTNTEPDTVGGYHIPAHSTLVLSAYVLHHRADLWPNPESFDPERFTPEQQKERHRYAYLPFGGGPRLCIGNNFALMEAALIMATIAQRVDLQLVPGHPVEMETAITLRPRYGIQIIVHAR